MEQRLRALILPTSAVGAALGIVFFELFSFGIAGILLLALMFFGVMSLSVVLGADVEKPALVLASVALGFALIFYAQAFSSENFFEFSQYNGEAVAVTGEVVNDPENRGSYKLVVLDASGVSSERFCGMVDEKVLVRADSFADVTYGDEAVVRGEASLPEPFETDQNRTFQYDEYLAARDIGAVVSFAEIKVLEQGRGNPIRSFLFRLKAAYAESVGKYIPSPESSLLLGLTIGAKEALGSELEGAFRDAGVIHIVVLSGYNVAIIAALIIAALRFASMKVRVGISAVLIALFVVLVGGGTTVVRASIMAVFALLARALGAEAAALRLLFLAALIMLFINPALLLHDPSFQLSFLATLGLIIGSPIVEERLFRIHSKAVREIISVTVATQIFVLPYLVFAIGQISLVALPANLLILGLVPFAMGIGALAGLLGIIAPFLAPLAAAPAFWILAAIIFIVEALAGLPFATVTFPPISLSALFIMYGLLGFFVYVLNRNKVVVYVARKAGAQK